MQGLDRPYLENVQGGLEWHWTFEMKKDKISRINRSCSSLFLLCIAILLIINAPTGARCFSTAPFKPFLRYHYQYQSTLILNNRENLEPAGFQLSGQIQIENIWHQRNEHDSEDYLILIELNQFQLKPRDNSKQLNQRYHQTGPLINEWPPVLVHLNTNDGHIKKIFVEKQDDHQTQNNQHLLEPTHLNLIMAIVNSLRNQQPSHTANKERWHLDSSKTLLIRESIQDDQMTTSRYSLLAPVLTNHWKLHCNLVQEDDDHQPICQKVDGWQNVTIGSKIFPDGHSKLYVKYSLELISEEKSTMDIRPKLSEATTITKAVYLYGLQVRQQKTLASLGPGHFHLERKPCQPQFCGTLQDFLKEYKKSLAEKHSLATNQLSISYLRLLNYIRTNSERITRKEMSKLLQKLSKNRQQDGNVLSTVLDVIAASRHGEAILAALDYLNLPKCQTDEMVNDCERFLVVMAISGWTTSNMGSSFIAEHSLGIEQLLDVLVPLTSGTDGHSNKWSDDRVKNSYALTIGTLLHSYHIFVKTVLDQVEDLTTNTTSHHTSTNLYHHSSPMSFEDVLNDDIINNKETNDKSRSTIKHHQQKLNEISDKIIKYLQQELEICPDTECRIVYLHALGNARVISRNGVFQTLKRHAIGKGRRESVAAMKAMIECVKSELQINRNMNDNFINRLKHLMIRILYDSSLETTSRLIATEILALPEVDPNGEILFELVQHLERFPSELATMIWKRSIQNVLNRKSEIPNGSNWHLHSRILSGSSTSFRYVMGGTGHANASYGVVLELLKAKLPKETSFSFDINRDNEFQDVISVGLFARGLESFAGESSETSDDKDNEIDSLNDSETEEDQSTLAGMNLKILGNQIRPFLFFSSTSELMGHLWSGAASEPTSVFKANLLISDYLDVKPLINGMLVEQSLKGVFSLDLNGEIQVSIWNRNSHSNVQTNGAILFQGSQEVYLTDRKTSARKLFSFGAESKLNFVTDFDFYSSPYRICIQITQPEFTFRHNTRKYEQVHSDDLHRRIHRRSYKIGAKSYVLNRDNSEMCASMNSKSDGTEFDSAFDF